MSAPGHSADSAPKKQSEGHKSKKKDHKSEKKLAKLKSEQAPAPPAADPVPVVSSATAPSADLPPRAVVSARTAPTQPTQEHVSPRRDAMSARSLKRTQSRLKAFEVLAADSSPPSATVPAALPAATDFPAAATAAAASTAPAVVAPPAELPALAVAPSAAPAAAPAAPPSSRVAPPAAHQTPRSDVAQPDDAPCLSPRDDKKAAKKLKEEEKQRQRTAKQLAKIKAEEDKRQQKEQAEEAKRREKEQAEEAKRRAEEEKKKAEEEKRQQKEQLEEAKRREKELAADEKRRKQESKKQMKAAKKKLKDGHNSSSQTTSAPDVSFAPNVTVAPVKLLSPEEQAEHQRQVEARRAELQQLAALPGNDRCADCGDTDPRWCSVNLGVFICIKCSGIHRSLGAHISKVRSYMLDELEEEDVKSLRERGNVKAAAAENELTVTRATPASSDEERRAWIIAKYTKAGAISSADENLLSGRARLATLSNTNAMTDYASLVIIKLHGAKNLPSADLNGTSDPYCIFRCARQEVRSSVVKKSLSPYWRETLRICIPSQNEPLELEVWDKDKVNDDFLGKATIPLQELVAGTKKRMTISLHGHKEKEQKEKEPPKPGKKSKKEKGKGHVHLSLILETLSH